MKLMPKEIQDKEVLQATAAGFEKQLEEAQGKSDPADRLKALLDTGRALDNHAEDLGRAMGRKISNLEAAAYLGLALGGTLVGAGVATLLSPAIGTAILITGIVGGITSTITGVARKFLEPRFMKQIEGHMERLNPTVGRVNDLVQQTLKDDGTQIAASDKFGDIYDRYPEVRDHFIKSFNQSAAKQELGIKTPKPAPATPGALKL